MGGKLLDFVKRYIVIENPRSLRRFEANQPVVAIVISIIYAMNLAFKNLSYVFVKFASRLTKSCLK